MPSDNLYRINLHPPGFCRAQRQACTTEEDSQRVAQRSSADQLHGLPGDYSHFHETKRHRIISVNLGDSSAVAGLKFGKRRHKGAA
jgi:hypothetical protein